MKISTEDLANIITIMETSSFDELIYESPEIKVVLSRGAQAATRWHAASDDLVPSVAPESVRHVPLAADASLPAVPVPAPDGKPSGGAGEDDNLLEISAPLMGTFYVAPESGARPFVKVGSRIAEGDTLCLLEVMKVFTAVTAQIAGIVEQVCARDGELVEYGQVLFQMRK